MPKTILAILLVTACALFGFGGYLMQYGESGFAVGVGAYIALCGIPFALIFAHALRHRLSK